MTFSTTSSGSVAERGVRTANAPAGSETTSANSTGARPTVNKNPRPGLRPAGGEVEPLQVKKAARERTTSQCPVIQTELLDAVNSAASMLAARSDWV